MPGIVKVFFASLYASVVKASKTSPAVFLAEAPLCLANRDPSYDAVQRGHGGPLVWLGPGPSARVVVLPP